MTMVNVPEAACDSHRGAKSIATGKTEKNKKNAVDVSVAVIPHADLFLNELGNCIFGSGYNGS
jgi:hypothetical protein